MKFYLCHTPEGRKRLVTRQDEAKKLDKSAEQIDIPVDQAGIKQGYEELFDKIFDLQAGLEGGDVPLTETDVLDSRPEVSGPGASKPDTTCPKCKWNSKMAESHAKRVERDATIDGLCEAIEHGPEVDLHRLVDSVIFRLRELSKSPGDL